MCSVREHIAAVEIGHTAGSDGEPAAINLQKGEHTKRSSGALEDRSTMVQNEHPPQLG